MRPTAGFAFFFATILFHPEAAATRGGAATTLCGARAARAGGLGCTGACARIGSGFSSSQQKESKEISTKPFIGGGGKKIPFALAQ